MEVPDPLPSENEVLIQTSYSAMSPGTELTAISQGSDSWGSLFQKGIRSWDKLKNSIERRGWQQTIAKIKEAVEKPIALGYSISGRVIRVGAMVQGYKPGDLVAAVGPGAWHGTLACVSQRFCTRIPDSQMLRDASTAALACTAIHAMHRAELSAGDEVAVFGLGVIGQFAVQSLRASGHRVIAFDPVEYRRSDAKTAGAEVYNPAEFDFETGMTLSSHGEGFDAVFLCAKAESPDLIRQAAALCRKRGRLIVVGEFPIQIPREVAYEKELEVRLSAAYGEGRYDPFYENFDRDYPIASCRWTVERNLLLFIRWLKEGLIVPSRLHPCVEPFRQATQVYSQLGKMSVLTILEYAGAQPARPILELQPRSRTGHSAIPVAVVGIGRFAVETHLPHLCQASDQFQLHTLVGRTPVKVAKVAHKFGAVCVTCDWEEAIKKDSFSAVLITTPNSLHANQVVAALECGKHVFVEKPLCLSLQELDCIKQAYLPHANSDPKHVLFVGFNRRYAPLSQKLFEERTRTPGPFEIRYEFRAPSLPSNEWYNLAKEGGRFLSEVCHAIDWIVWLIGYPVRKKVVIPGSGADVYLEFEDSSRAHLHYRPVLRLSGPKEKVEVHRGTTRWQIEDFVHLRTFDRDILRHEDHWKSKGHREILDAFAATIAHPLKGDDPYGFFASSRLTLELDQALKT